jgi:hypothetical protein
MISAPASVTRAPTRPHDLEEPTMRLPATLVLTTLFGLAAPPARAADDLPNLRVFGGSAMQRGQWRMDLIEMQRGGKDSQAAAGLNGTSICMDNMAQMARENRQSGGKCTTKVLKNLPNVAQVETRCPDSSYRSTITREAAGRFLVDGAGTRASGDTFAMKVRYSYQGECRAGASAGTVALDKSGPQCKRMRDQLARMSPDKACRNLTEEQRRICEGQLQQSAARINSMCPQ